MFMSCTCRSSSSLINCAFEESKSKSVSNLRVADGTLATISWPLLRFLRLRAPEMFFKLINSYRIFFGGLFKFRKKNLICHCFTNLPCLLLGGVGLFSLFCCRVSCRALGILGPDFTSIQKNPFTLTFKMDQWTCSIPLTS